MNKPQPENLSDRPAQATAGGWGSGLPVSRADLALLRKAIRSGWPIPAHVRPLIVGDVVAGLGAESERKTLAAVRAIVAMDTANLKAAARSGR